MKSISSSLARALYGKSDKANDRENQSDEWQAGYKHGLAARGSESIEQEWERRGRVMSAGFREWKRGMWAAAIQRAELNATENQS